MNPSIDEWEPSETGLESSRRWYRISANTTYGMTAGSISNITWDDRPVTVRNEEKWSDYSAHMGAHVRTGTALAVAFAEERFEHREEHPLEGG
ncbi:MAG: hypothetical protein KA978_27345 [Deltaproteobacteria bacterium]|nr:hypothetical protein [Deltaproteobacteria bacterium]